MLSMYFPEVLQRVLDLYGILDHAVGVLAVLAVLAVHFLMRGTAHYYYLDHSLNIFILNQLGP